MCSPARSVAGADFVNKFADAKQEVRKGRGTEIFLSDTITAEMTRKVFPPYTFGPCCDIKVVRHQTLTAFQIQTKSAGISRTDFNPATSGTTPCDSLVIFSWCLC